MVIPRSRSRSMLSMNCALRSRSVSEPVASSSRSASVDLPWSMWAMIEKLRIRRVGVSIWGRGRRRSLAAGRDVQCELSREVVPFFFQDHVDPLPDVLGDWNARLRVQLLELFVLLGRDVDGRGNLLPRHGVTMHDHRSGVKFAST